MNQLTLNECSKRKLDETYLVVYAIKNEINIVCLLRHFQKIIIKTLS